MKKLSGLTLPQKVIEGLCGAILLGMVLGPVLFWGRLPGRIPGHYNGAGEIDRWAGKWELLLLPVFGAVMYVFLTFCCALIGEAVKRGEAPPSACTWISGTKLVVIGTFAIIEWHSAVARPMGTWLLPADIALLAVLMTGFLVSCIRFAAGRGKNRISLYLYWTYFYKEKETWA